MMNVTLNDIYEQYKKSTGKKQDCYATLYKQAKGKKEVSKQTPEVVWFISAVERIHRAYPKYADLGSEHARKKSELERAGNKLAAKQLEHEFLKEVSEFYFKRFRQTLEYACYMYGLKLEEDIDGTNYRYRLKIEGVPVVLGTLKIVHPYPISEILETLIDVECQLYMLRGQRMGPGYKEIMQDFAKEIENVLQYSNLKIS